MKNIVTYKAGEAIYLSGQMGPVYRVTHGSVRLDRMFHDGHVAFANLAIAGDLIGAEVLLNQSYGFEAYALTDCEIEEWKEPSYLWVESFAKELMKVSQRQTDAVSLRCGPAMERILKLIQLIQDPSSEAYSKVVFPRLKDVAEITDLTIETVSRCISALRKQGVLTPISGNLRSQFKVSQLLTQQVAA
jgi:CRP-like cAMP-binding protein